MFSRFEDLLTSNKIPFETNVPLKSKTWIHTGGLCRYWVKPADKQQLETVCRYLYAEGHRFDVVGQTSNMFFHESYNPDVVVSTIGVNSYEIQGKRLICDCGVSVIQLAKQLLSEGYAGFYGLVGLPGTVASAIINNAGCFKCSLSSMLESVEFLQADGRVVNLSREQLQYAHRTSVLKRREMQGTVISVTLELSKADDWEKEKKKSEESVAYRKNHQEGMALNLGSVFSGMRMKRNLPNMTAVGLARIKAVLGLDSYDRALKKLLLSFYGYKDLDSYISDKKLNTFVWRDNNAEGMFLRYKEFMGKVYDRLRIEIEERA